MVNAGFPEHSEGEHLPPPKSPEETCIDILKGLAKEPTNENFAEVQALFDTKLEAAQTDIDSFRFIVAYLRERDQEAAMRSLDSRFPARENPPYDYTVSYEIQEYRELSLKQKIAHFVLRKEYPEPDKVEKTQTRSVLDDFSSLRIDLPANWNDLAIKYMALPDHHVLQLPSRYHQASLAEEPTQEEPMSTWDLLKEAKIEFARRTQAQSIGGSTDFNWWGYQRDIEEQAGVVLQLHEAMGLSYKDGYLVEESK